MKAEKLTSIPHQSYSIEFWGKPYFGINEDGHVILKTSETDYEGDIYELVTNLVERGIEPPVLIRFDAIIRERLKLIHQAFHNAIQEAGYKNTYKLAYPIKVNPQRHVVDLIVNLGKTQQIGLEVGSKPELIAVLTLDGDGDSLLLCNGYKDAHYIELALLARKLGRRSIIIIEQPYELSLVLETAQKLNIEPEIGLRMKLSSKGSGRWSSSGGEHAKFRLSSDEIMTCIQELKTADKLDKISLLHFHMGSQITSWELCSQRSSLAVS